MPTQERDKPGKGEDQAEGEGEEPLVKGPEMKARMAIYQWQEANARFSDVKRRMSTATTVNFNCQDCGEKLLDEYKEAREDLDRAEKGLESKHPSGELKKDVREQLEQKIQADAKRGQENAATAGLTEAQTRERLQELERERNRRESEEAARNMDRAGAPGLPAQPGEPAQRAPADISRKSSLDAETKNPTPNIPPRLGQKEEEKGSGGSAPQSGGRRGKPETSGTDSGPNPKGSPSGAAAEVSDAIEGIRRPGTGDPAAKVDISPAISQSDTVGADSAQQMAADAKGREASGQQTPEGERSAQNSQRGSR